MSDPAAALTEADIERLVDRFYDRVQADAVLGPIFNPLVHDWPEHKATLVRFWSSVTLKAGSYRGNPMAVHRSLPVNAAHFQHWLHLWRDTAQRTLTQEQADLFYSHAQRIAGSLMYGMGLDPARRPLHLDVMDH